MSPCLNALLYLNAPFKKMRSFPYDAKAVKKKCNSAPKVFGFDDHLINA